ncbi:RNA polymerase factor sigma-54 [bacterium]|nr:RNA polymerase factor sigma-54 [bacterium]
MLKQSLSQKLSQRLSPQQIQLMKLVQLPTLALEERIQEELEENPALEEGEDLRDEEQNALEFDGEDSTHIEADDINIDEYLSDDEIPDYRVKSNNYAAEDEGHESPLSEGIGFYEALRSQIGMLSLDERSRQLAEYLVGNLDEDGYLRRELEAVVDDLAFSANVDTSLEQLELVLEAIQSLEPAGIGARDLRECLLLQINRKPRNESVALASIILTDYFEEFVRKHYDRIMDRLSCDEAALREALAEIGKLNPKPGNSTDSGGRQPDQVVVPDFLIQLTDGTLELSLNGRNAPELNVSRVYREMLETYKASQSKSREQKEAVLFVKQKIDSARWFIDAIKQRQQTLLMVMGAIVEKQQAYLLSGDERDLEPMILKDIAEATGLDISTVSRVASNKYVQTPYGSFLIKDLFSESMTNEQGEEVSTREIKSILEELIGAEDKRRPLTDEKLMELLHEKGYPIARRTVAKYREQLGISTARMRKEL